MKREIEGWCAEKSSKRIKHREASAALANIAGPGYREAASALTPAKIGCIVVTPGFGLRAKYVFHGITIGYDNNEKCVDPSRDIAAEIVDDCFYHADTFRTTSLALPLLGTGAGGLSRDVSLDMMFRVISKRLLRPATTVRRVEIVLRRSETGHL